MLSESYTWERKCLEPSFASGAGSMWLASAGTGFWKQAPILSICRWICTILSSHSPPAADTYCNLSALTHPVCPLQCESPVHGCMSSEWEAGRDRTRNRPQIDRPINRARKKREAISEILACFSSGIMKIIVETFWNWENNYKNNYKKKKTITIVFHSSKGLVYFSGL